jgi:hypothetical protein
MSYTIALLWGLLGWITRVVWTYYTHSKLVESKKGGRFVWSTFIKKYDQDWIMGFVAMVAFSLISDWAWEAFLSNMITGSISDYDPKVNVLIGFLSILIIEKFISKSGGN